MEFNQAFEAPLDPPVQRRRSQGQHVRSIAVVSLISHLASVRLPSTWPATPRRQGDGQLFSPPASASAPSNSPANVKTVEFAKTILTCTRRAYGWGRPTRKAM